MKNDWQDTLTTKQAKEMDREMLVSWLDWNDSNGCYNDEDSEIEGFMPLTKEEALEYVCDQLERD